MAHHWYILMNVSFHAFHLKLYLKKKLRTHNFFIPALWFWSCSQHSHSWADRFRADWLFGGQKPTSHGMSGALNFLMPFVESYSGESCKHFSYCNLMIKIIQISRFRIQRTNHDHQNNPLKLLWAPYTEAFFFLSGVICSSARAMPRGCSETRLAHCTACFSVLARGG